jgi:hypothetical protein
MRRTASVLGSALVTLALAGSPAWASPPAQSTENSTGAAQLGPVEVDAPVRIASDGDNQGAAQSKGGSQGIDGSTGAAQVGPGGANAPVRVLSDGDNEAAAQDGSTGEQSTTDSEGAAQLGPVEVDAPVRIASDGDNQGAAQSKGGSQGIDGSTGPTEGSMEPTEDGIHGAQPNEEDPAAGVGPASGSIPSEGGPAAAAPSTGHNELPFTGLAVWLLLVIGIWALGSGLCLHRLLGLQEVRIRSF